MRFFILMCCLVLLSACQSFPKNPHTAKSQALTARSLALSPPYSTPKPNSDVNDDSQFLPQTYANAQAVPDLSGYRLVSSGADALSLRVQLIKLAKKTIDIQYYIWHDDQMGVFMLKQLWQAGERGVLVRLLIDDFNSTPATDKLFAKLASHPNIAVRLANPMIHRKFRQIDFVRNPLHAQVRMHNKSMTFDGKVSIIGGRNIGNEYLNNHPSNNFADLDMVVSGKVVGDVERSFDDYWQSSRSVDVELLTKSVSPIDLNTINHTEQTAYQNATQTAFFVKNHTPLRQAKVWFFADSAKKLSLTHHRDDLLISKLKAFIGKPTQKVSIISSYFAPTKDGVKLLTTLAKQGIHISILTNAYNATDVHSVHAGYGHWRKDLLKAGIQIYEFKHNATSPNHPSNKSYSLHAKAFAVDDLTFIGSYNIDPRSANINSELSVVIADKGLSTHLHKALNNNHTDTNTNTKVTNPTLLYQAYQVELDTNGRLRWTTIENDKLTTYHQEPKTNLPQRITVNLLSLLPIDGFL